MNFYGPSLFTNGDTFSRPVWDPGKSAEKLGVISGFTRILKGYILIMSITFFVGS